MCLFWPLKLSGPACQTYFRKLVGAEALPSLRQPLWGEDALAGGRLSEEVVVLVPTVLTRWHHSLSALCPGAAPGTALPLLPLRCGLVRGRKRRVANVFFFWRRGECLEESFSY